MELVSICLGLNTKEQKNVYDVENYHRYELYTMRELVTIGGIYIRKDIVDSTGGILPVILPIISFDIDWDD